MTPTEIREELLRQHRDLRAQVDEVREACLVKPAARDTSVRQLVASLVDDLTRHNHREEELLRDLLPTVDAWGTVRREIMSEEHVAEHEAMCAALANAALLTETSTSRSFLDRALDRIVMHMNEEEKRFLTELALGESDVVVDQIAG